MKFQTAISAVILGTVLLFSAKNPAAKEKKEPVEVIFTLKSAEIAPKKENKKSWDLSFGKWSKPDVYVIISTGKTTILKSEVAKNTLTPHWKISKIVKISPKDIIEIQVWDKDIKKDDLVGKKLITLSELVKAKELSFGQVKKLILQVEFVKIKLPKK